MSVGKKNWTIVWRISVAVVLLGWIFHAIFSIEAKLSLANQGVFWDSLSKSQQLRQAWSLGPKGLWHHITLIEPKAFALSLFFMAMTIFLGVVRWQIVLRSNGLVLSFRRALSISMVAHFFNAFLLGSTGGDLIKAFYAARETHHKKPEAVMTVFVDRVLGLWAMLLFAILMSIPNWWLWTGNREMRWVVGFTFLLLLAATTFLVLAFWGGVSKKWPQARSLLQRVPFGSNLERSLEGCRVFARNQRTLLQCVGISMLLNTFCVLQLITVARGLHLEVPNLVMFMIVPAVICISALPITPSGLGVRENLFVLLLSIPALGIFETQALALSLLAYAGSLFWSLAGGLVYLFLKKREHLDEFIQKEELA